MVLGVREDLTDLAHQPHDRDPNDEQLEEEPEVHPAVRVVIEPDADAVVLLRALDQPADVEVAPVVGRVRASQLPDGRCWSLQNPR